MSAEVDASGSSSPDLEAQVCPRADGDMERLMARYQQGDAEAAQALVDQLSSKLYLFFSTQLGDRQHADDMLQETWLRIHRARHGYRPGDALLPWVYAIARRVRVDHYRRRRRIERRETASNALEHLRVETGAAPTLPSFEDLTASLPESQREVLVLLKVNGLSLEEVARATSSTVGSVKQKVHRAYDRLRALLPNRLSTAAGERQ